MNIEAAKIEVIKAITEIQSEFMIKQFQLLLHQFKEETPKEVDKLAVAYLPTPSIINLKQLKKEQQYDVQGINAYYKHLDRSIWKGENLKELLQVI